MTEGYKGRIGSIIRDARKHRGLTQQQLAERLSTSQSAINRIEKGHQNLSLDMLARIGSALDSEIVALGAGPTHALAPELTLRPVLAEIGGTTVRGLYVLDSRYDDPAAYADWLDANRTAVTRLTGNLTGAPA